MSNPNCPWPSVNNKSKLLYQSEPNHGFCEKPAPHFSILIIRLKPFEITPNAFDNMSVLKEAPSISTSDIVDMAPPMDTASHGRVKARPYLWPHNGPVTLQNTALVIIDMQMDFCAPGGYLDVQGIDITPTRRIIPTIESMLGIFRVKGFQIYHTREGHRPDLSTLSSREKYRSKLNPTGIGMGEQGPLGRLLVRGERGHEIIPELTPLPSEPIIDKPGRSAFRHTDFKLLLDNRGITNLILCGVTTDVCVSSTMRDANDQGLDCLLVTDATAAAEQHLHDSAIDSVCSEGGIFGSTASVTDIILMLRDVPSLET